MRIWNYGTLKKFKRGVHLVIVLTYKCNMDCSYCVCKEPDGVYPTFKKEKTLEEWQEFISTFPFKIKEVTLSGGEPLLSKVAVPFTNWLTDREIFTVLQTNLSIRLERLQELKDSYNLRIVTVFHDKEMHWVEYSLNFDYLKQFIKKANIRADGLGHKTFDFQRHKDLVDAKDLDDKVRHKLFVGIDMKMYRSCLELHSAYK